MARDRIERGERAPDFALPRGPDGDRVRFYGRVGGSPSAVVFSGADAEAGLATARRLRDADPTLDVHLVVHGDDTTVPDVFVDPTGGVHGAYGIATTASSPVVVMLDRNVRVRDAVQADDPDDLDELVAAGAHAAGAREPRHQHGFAPVLFVPGAVQPDLCAHLVATFTAADPVAGEVETTADGRRDEALDHLRKRRRDLVVEDPDLLRTLTRHVGRRVIPEVAKAFSFRADRFEGFKLGAYDEHDSGFFAAHRDNLSPSTQHRRFGVSINLDDDYEGGELCFPEYGPDLYRPDAGEALVFSGSHLHEVRPVTAGRRHVLLSFLFAGSR